MNVGKAYAANPAHLITCTYRVELLYSYTPLIFYALHTDCPVTIAPTNDFNFGMRCRCCFEQSSMPLHTQQCWLFLVGESVRAATYSENIETPRKITCHKRTA